MKLFLDTNIFLRFYLSEEKQHPECVQLISKIEEGLFIPYTSNTVITEVSYALLKYYKQTKNETVTKLEAILNIRNMTIIEKTTTKKALELFKKLNIKLGDCLIVNQIPSDTTLVTYDEDFKKIKGLSLATPAELVNN